MRRHKPHTGLSLKHIFVISIALSSSMPAQSQDGSETSSWSCALSVEAVSKYLWRGANLHNGPAIQPNVECAWHNLTFGGWASYNLGSGWNRNPGLSDLYPYVQLDQPLPGLETATLQAGFILYTYPLCYSSPGVDRYSPEASLGLSFDLPGAPTLTFYKDFFFGSFFEAALSHAQPFWGKMAMESEVIANYARQERLWSTLLFRMSLTLGKSAFFAVNIYYQAALSSAYDNAFFLGVAIAK